MTAELGLLVVGAVVAGFVQGLSGFAFSMVAISGLAVLASAVPRLLG